jgi:hypothetical protein
VNLHAVHAPPPHQCQLPHQKVETGNTPEVGGIASHERSAMHERLGGSSLAFEGWKNPDALLPARSQTD